MAELIAPYDPIQTRAGLASVEQSQAPAVIATARAHGVEAWLAGCAPADGVAWVDLREQRNLFTAARLRRRADLSDLAAAFAQIDCAWVVLKGDALALSVYPRPDLRFGVDVDVLIPPERLSEAIDVLTAGRFELLDRNWPLIRRYVPGELKLRSERGTLIDLHWHLINSSVVRSRFRLPTSDLLGARRQIGDDLWGLSATDQLLHTTLHAAQSGGNRLSWLLDLALAADARSVRETIAPRAITVGAGPALGLMLDRARHYFAVGSVRGEGSLPGAWYREMGTVVDRLSRPHEDVEQPSLARSYARSARSSSAASLAELARHGTSWLRSGAPRLYRRPRWADHLDEGSLLRPVHDDRARAEYFDEITHHS